MILEYFLYLYHLPFPNSILEVVMARFSDKTSVKSNILMLMLVVIAFSTLIHGCSKLKLDVKGEEEEEGKP